jgi:hypothetical protein
MTQGLVSPKSRISTGNWEVSEVARISTRMKEFSDQTCLKKANATLMAAAADDDDDDPSTSTVCSTWVHATFESKSQSNSHHSLLLVELVLCGEHSRRQINIDCNKR